jgi:hypothetical protein
MARKNRMVKSATDQGSWSATVTRQSNALDLQPDLFTLSDPCQIATSLKRSAERSRRRKGSAFQCAMSMLNFYINRAGTHLSSGRKQTLRWVKLELRKLYRRD